MTATQTEIQSQVIELSTEALKAFCEDLAGMFDVDIECGQQQPCTETVQTLKKRFKKLAAVNTIKSKGTLDGTFQIVLDREGLFTLAGVVVMQPEQRIMENRKRGTAKDAEDIADATREAGNLLVGSWDRIFREELEGHDHFTQANTFIGDPWNDPEGTISLAGDEEFLFVPYEMTIGSYPTFNVGIIFPKTIFGRTPEAKPQNTEKTEEKPQIEVKQEAEQQQTIAEKVEPEQTETPIQKAVKESKPVESVAEETVDTPVHQEQTPIEIDAKDVLIPVEVLETVQKIEPSPASLQAGAPSVFSAISAKDIMQKQVVWITPEDSIQNALTKIQQADNGYMLVGINGVLEGILSKSDIASAVSIYLRPMFTKWRRKLDDATLKIRVKWIMSKPVHTIKPETSLSLIMDNMCQLGRRALPVVDQQGKVAGLVTVFDVLRALLNSNPDVSLAGKATQVLSQA